MIGRTFEIVLLFFLCANTGELVFRRFFWHQVPPELPPWAFLLLVLFNAGFGWYALRAWAREGAARRG